MHQIIISPGDFGFQEIHEAIRHSSWIQLTCDYGRCKH